jgi:hypothetical protein
MAIWRGPSWWPVAGYVAFSVASKTAVFAGIRLRMQVEPFLVLFAALAITTLARAMMGLTPPAPLPYKGRGEAVDPHPATNEHA